MAGTNNITRNEAQGKSLFPSAKNLIDATISFNQGDLLYLDTTNHLIKKPASEANGATFLGVAVATVVLGKIASPYNTDVVASQGISDIPGPLYSVVAKLTLKTGDSLSPGGLVYLDPGTGTDGVTATGTKAIGVYQGAVISGAAAGTKVEILLGCRAPSDVLTF